MIGLNRTNKISKFAATLTRTAAASLLAISLVSGSTAMAKPVDINSANAAEIAESLSGIGPATAAAIVEFRSSNGAFTSLEGLTSVKGIGAATIEKNSADIQFGNAASANLDNLLSSDADSIAAAAVEAGAAVNINTASVEELAAGLAGIGPSTAQSIVEYREANGPFASIDALENVSGIGGATIDKNFDLITVGNAAVDSGADAALLDNLLADAPGVDLAALEASDSVNINTASADQLATTLTGIGAATAQSIVDYRELNGPFQSIDELANVKGIGPATLESNASLITLSADPLASNTGNDATPAAAPTTVINVNTASQVELEALTFIGPVKAQRIIEYRNANGSIDSLDEFAAIQGIGDRTIELNQQWIRF